MELRPVIEGIFIIAGVVGIVVGVVQLLDRHVRQKQEAVRRQRALHRVHRQDQKGADG